MPETDTMPPRHLLLATDLSARCDRATDRALALSRVWGARLTVVHALDALDALGDDVVRPALSDAAMRAARLMREDFEGLKDVTVSFQVSEGQPEDVVLAAAAEKGCDLTVTGISGHDPMGQHLIGGTVTALTRRAAVPVLIVKRRPRAAYERIVVASDLSNASTSALEMALRLFRPEQLTFFHAFDVPFANWIDDKPRNERERRAAVLDEIRTFLAGVVRKDIAEAMEAHAEQGDPAPALSDYVVQEDTDLVIAGTHGRAGLMNILLGSAAAAILHEVPCDVMIVPSRGIRAST